MFAFLMLLILDSCAGGGGSGTDAILDSTHQDLNYSIAESDTAVTPTYPAKPASLRVSLIDAPHGGFDEVHVNVKHVELWLSGKGKQARLIVAQNLGDVDLLTLRNGVQLLLADVDMPSQVSISAVRIVLNESGHFGVKSNGGQCDMQTPSAQQSGIKVLLSSPVTFEDNYVYSLVIDFDALKSVVVKGNGGCLLKPVLKIASFVKTPVDNTPVDGGPSDDPEQEEPIGGGETNDPGNDGSTGDGSGSGSTDGGSDGGESIFDINDPSTWGGFDPSDPSTWPEGITEADLRGYF